MHKFVFQNSIKMKKISWFLFAFFAVGVGLYPVIYLFVDMRIAGLLATKSAELLSNNFWNTSFYLHIGFGGLSLLIGWIQFSKKFRTKHLQVHRLLGKVYVLSVIISGLAGLHIAVFATGGITAQAGFFLLAVFWLFTTSQAYMAIGARNIEQHEKWMIRSYALTFAAVTLRLWMPLLIGLAAMQFMEAYRLIAWLCWIPNLLLAEALVHKKSRRKPVPSSL